MLKVNKIIVSGDLFRLKVTNKKLTPFHYVRIKRYYELLKFQFEKASGLKVEIMNNHPDEPCYEGYKLAGINPKDSFDWVDIYDLKEIPQGFIEWYRKKIEGALVVYVEVNKTIKKVHNILNVPYIDIMPHPIRFLDDHLFAVSTNNKDVFNYFNSTELKQFDNFYVNAQLFKTQLAAPISGLKENSVLLVGQSEIDKSLIVNGSLKSLNNFYNEIEDLLSRYNHIYFAPHPYVSDYSIYNCLHNIKKLEFIKHPTYHLLTQPEIVAIAGISSSAIYEGKFFGKECHFFKKNYECMEEAPTFNEEYYFSFGKESILQPAFWGPLFGNVKLEKLDIAFYPNQIRAALNDYWAYTEWDPVVRTVKRSQYGERINKTLRLDLVSNLNSLNHDVLDLKKELSKVNITSSSNLKVVKERKAINNDNLIIIKFLQIIGLKKLNELIIFKALNDKLKKCVPLNASNKRICCYTYRPRAIEGGRGGGGAVQSAMQQILGDSYKDAKIEYIYSEKDGVWHTLKNKFFTKKRFPKIFPSQTDLMQLWTAMVFIYDKAKDKSGVFITHEIFSAYALALLKKKYVLVLHSQGSKVHEMTALGEKTTAVTRYIINKCEEMALKGAYKVYFPSLGARLSFLKDTNYKGNNISEMPLYNTVYAHPEFVPHETLIRDDNYITLISIGTMTESKGQDQSLKYVKKLASSSDKKIRWLCVGKGPLKNKVVSEANDAMEQYSNLDIIFLEKVPYPTVKYLLSISDIYLMLHRVSIFDLATLEAMETGLMLILSRIGGNLEFNVCNNVKYDDENFNLDANEIEKYKQLSLEAFKTFNNESFKKIYHKVFDDLIG